MEQSELPEFPPKEIPVFFFDLGSPYSYLAAERIHELIPGVVWRPILLGGLFTRFDRRSWSETDERAAGMAEVERRARERGLPDVRWPDPWPGNTLYAMRVATFAASIDRAAPFALAAFRQAFVAGRDLTVPDNVLIAAAACELHPKAVLAAAESAGIKAALKEATEKAADRGVRGVPSVLIEDEVFWGDDELQAAAEALRTLQS
jgi:2-hydroxychromene-2-carboxylate isomerase